VLDTRLDLEWQLQAACRGMDSDVFYASGDKRGQSLARHERAAKQVCAGCPVTAACLTWALRTGEPDGIWGGRTPKERAELY
jgi:WhiB family transcriptional regulator, redox-sensing transcriptional regulator